MEYLSKGQFFGQTHTTLNLEGITLTDTEYTHDTVDWHYHENAYFTFVLQGNVIEGNKKEVYNCTTGSLLFHNWQEPHYNIKPKGFTRGFHIEIDQHWFNSISPACSNLQGSMSIANPEIKLLMYKIFRETKTNDNASALSISGLLLQTLSQMFRNTVPDHKKPLWVAQVQELMNDRFTDTLTLDHLSAASGIHPVHLSRDFPKYFHCSFGEYLRKLRVARSLALIFHKNMALTQIALECGFADQSHFTRCFKEQNGITPSEYRKILFR